MGLQTCQALLGSGADGDEGEAMTQSTARNLVVCCDGTGNVWRASGSQTNVVRLVQALHPDPARQIVYYDPGVGTAAGLGPDSGGLGWKDRLRRAAGLAWGHGVWSNVAQAYQFLMAHHRPGDRIFLIGFSRGAFTVRAVAGLIHLCGLMRIEHENLLPALLQTYRMADSPGRQEAGESYKTYFARPDTSVWFTGVWDSVESVGMTSILLGAHITSNREVKATYRHIRHAVALDERRAPYLPRLYDAPNQLQPGQSFEQVYFCGAHSDVGGGYDEDGLSNAAWHWMLREANALGLLVRPEAFGRFPQHCADLLHDETVGFPPWVLVGAFTRPQTSPSIHVHETVRQRMAQADCAYAPPLPPVAQLVATRTQVLDPDGTVRDLPVPLKPAGSLAGLRKVRPGLGHGVWLMLAAVATALLFGTMGSEQLRLACLQLWRTPFFELGAAIQTMCGQSSDCLNGLLVHDGFAILAYTALVPVAAMQLLQFSRRGDSIGMNLGRLARAGAVLPLADGVENWATQAAWSAHVATSCSPLGCGLVEGLYSLLVSVASASKFAALALLIGLAVACLVSRPFSRRPS
jgi:uncharacterized protein (DUF2235 family)